MLRICRRLNATLTGLSANLSVQGRTKGNAPLTLRCMDLIKFPSADLAQFEFDDLNAWVAQRSDSELDLFASDERGITGDISVYSKIAVKAQNGKTSISNLEAPSVKIRSVGGDVELNSIKIANSILGEAISIKSESGDVSLNGRTVGDILAHSPAGSIQGDTLQSLTLDLRAKTIEIQSAYAGNILLRAGEWIKVKNMNGSADIESGGDCLIDGMDGDLKVNAGGIVDVHLDSSLKTATLKSSQKIIIRTPPDQNTHLFSVKSDSKIEIDGFSGVTKSEKGERIEIQLAGENTAGHPRKVAFVGFGGNVLLDAPEVSIRAESWMQKQMGQNKKFSNVQQEPWKNKANFRFY